MARPNIAAGPNEVGAAKMASPAKMACSGGSHEICIDEMVKRLSSEEPTVPRKLKVFRTLGTCEEP